MTRVPAGSFAICEILKPGQRVIKFFKNLFKKQPKNYNHFFIYWLDDISIPTQNEEVYIPKKPYSKVEKRKLIELLSKYDINDFEMVISVINTIRPNTFIPNANIKDIRTNKYYKLLDESDIQYIS